MNTGLCKNAGWFIALVAVCAMPLLLSACATSKSVSGSYDFGAVKNKVWKLAEVKDSSGELIFRSEKLDKKQFGDVYTMQFDDTFASGKAAPNRYNAAYALGTGNAISFKPAASTRMLAFEEPEGLREHEFYDLLQKAVGWNLTENRLFIYTGIAESPNLIMVFDEFDHR